MATITKKDLIDRIADRTDQKRVVVKRTVQMFLDEIVAELGNGNRLEFRDFGVFEIKQRAPRIAQNPKTLERVEVPSRKTIKFKIGRLMKDAVEGEPAGTGEIVTRGVPKLARPASDKPGGVKAPRLASPDVSVTPVVKTTLNHAAKASADRD